MTFKHRAKAKANQTITIGGKDYRLRMTDCGVEVREKYARGMTPIPLARIVQMAQPQPEMVPLLSKE